MCSPSENANACVCTIVWRHGRQHAPWKRCSEQVAYSGTFAGWSRCMHAQLITFRPATGNNCVIIKSQEEHACHCQMEA
eukprot:9455848-Heterocapsa_arctica.AAC.1